MRAKDDEGSGVWATPRKIEIQSSIIISLPVDSVSFGLLVIGVNETNDTTNDSPPPFLLQNDGNSK